VVRYCSNPVVISTIQSRSSYSILNNNNRSTQHITVKSTHQIANPNSFHFPLFSLQARVTRIWNWRPKCKGGSRHRAVVRRRRNPRRHCLPIGTPTPPPNPPRTAPIWVFPSISNPPSGPPTTPFQAPSACKKPTSISYHASFLFLLHVFVCKSKYGFNYEERMMRLVLCVVRIV